MKFLSSVENFLTSLGCILIKSKYKCDSVVYKLWYMSKFCSTKNILKIIELCIEEKIRHFELLPLYCTSSMGSNPSQIMQGASKG